VPLAKFMALLSRNAQIVTGVDFKAVYPSSDKAKFQSVPSSQWQRSFDKPLNVVGRHRRRQATAAGGARLVVTEEARHP
jgi:hypothetical protein